MIRIHKPAEVPEVLTRQGKRRRDRMCRDYDRSPADYDSRTKKFTFDSSLYGHREVKEALATTQHGKCCFCETKIGKDGDVEHYRPKACYSQDRGDTLHGPGYYWLAYEWSNLLLSCSICNQRYKKNLFPLSDPAQRATSHHGDLTAEDPLLIHPVEQDPEEFISFRREIPYPIDGNPYGTATIEVLGLRREGLNERRRELLDKLARTACRPISNLASREPARFSRMRSPMLRSSLAWPALPRAPATTWRADPVRASTRRS